MPDIAYGRVLASLGYIVKLHKGVDVEGVRLGRKLGFGYARAITVTNNRADTLTDYPVSFTFDHASLVSAGKIRADLEDLFIYDPETGSFLPWWVERGVMTSSCKIWFKVPSLPGRGSKTYYMFYGNPYTSARRLGYHDIQKVFIRGASFDYGLDPGWSVSVASGSPSPVYYMGFVEICGSQAMVLAHLSVKAVITTTYPVMLVLRCIPTLPGGGNMHACRLDFSAFESTNRVYYVYFRGDGYCVIERWSSSEGAAPIATAGYTKGHRILYPLL